MSFLFNEPLPDPLLCKVVDTSCVVQLGQPPWHMYLIHERIHLGLLEVLDPCCCPEMCLSHFPDTAAIAAVGARAGVECANWKLADSVKTHCTTETDTQFLDLFSSLPLVWPPVLLLAVGQYSGLKFDVCVFFHLGFLGLVFWRGVFFFKHKTFAM